MRCRAAASAARGRTAGVAWTRCPSSGAPWLPRVSATPGAELPLDRPLDGPTAYLAGWVTLVVIPRCPEGSSDRVSRIGAVLTGGGGREVPGVVGSALVHALSSARTGGADRSAR